jgi:hypothetical protein
MKPFSESDIPSAVADKCKKIKYRHNKAPSFSVAAVNITGNLYL